MKYTIRFIAAIALLVMMATSFAAPKIESKINFINYVYPSRLILYKRDNIMLLTPFKLAKKIEITVDNSYKGKNGTYIACNHAMRKRYDQLIGYIRVPGYYIGPYAIPETGNVKQKNTLYNATNDHLVNGKALSELCGRTFKKCSNNQCVPGTHTGGMFFLAFQSSIKH